MDFTYALSVTHSLGLYVWHLQKMEGLDMKTQSVDQTNVHILYLIELLGRYNY